MELKVCDDLKRSLARDPSPEQKNQVDKFIKKFSAEKLAKTLRDTQDEFVRENVLNGEVIHGEITAYFPDVKQFDVTLTIEKLARFVKIYFIVDNKGKFKLYSTVDGKSVKMYHISEYKISMNW